MTSFGEGESDGLLTFREIYDLRIDADLVILSACDTAGKATVATTREAGVTTGGDYALDGLVRAFVGAGGRSRSEEHTSELQSLMRTSYAVFCLQKNKHTLIDPKR